MENSESRIAPSPEAASDDFASPSSSQPGDAADRLAFEPVPLRYREDGLTPEKQRAYVEALADCGVAREAAARVGLSEQAINRVRRRSDARSFDNACEAAHLFGARRLRSIAYERAIEGTLKGHYYRGELVSQERVYDNRLLIYLLGKTAHLLDPPAEARTVCDNWERHMDSLERGLPPPDVASAKEERNDCKDAFATQEVWQEEDGSWRTAFPPPDGFEGDEEGVWNGFNWYSRSLSAEEEAAVEALLAADEVPIADVRAGDCDRRDRFFGFAGGDDLSSGEAEPYETSEPSDPDLGLIEYKSLVPPRRTGEPLPFGDPASLKLGARLRQSAMSGSAPAGAGALSRPDRSPSLRR